MKEFGKWFKEIAWKKYAAVCVAILVVDVVFLASYGGIWSDGGEGASTMHIIMVALAHVVVVGANVGVAYHMLSSFRKRNI